jgi:peptidoglycan pentaglycine glycine transferase (the first glycine)
VPIGAGAPELREFNDRAAWNPLVLTFRGVNVRHGFEWGEIRRQQGWIPFRIALVRGESCEAAAVVYSRPLPSGLGSVLVSPAGLLAREDAQGSLRALMAGIDGVAARTRAVFLRVSPRLENGSFDRGTAALGFTELPDLWTTWNDPRVVMTLDIRGSEDELKRGMREKFRQTLDKAIKKGVTVERGSTEDHVRRFHRLLSRSGGTKGQPVRSLSTFLAIRREYLEPGLGCLLLASHNGSDIACMLAIRFGPEASFMYSALDSESEAARKLKPGLALHWEMIRWAKAVGCQSIDWGGTGTGYPPSETDPGYGIYMFKLGFGCVPQLNPPYADRVYRPLAYRMVRLAEGRLLPIGWHLRARLNAWIH